MQLRKITALVLVSALTAPNFAFAISPVPREALDIPPALLAVAAVRCQAPGVGKTDVINLNSPSNPDGIFADCEKVVPAANALEEQAKVDCPSGVCDGSKPINAEQKFSDILAAAEKASCSTIENSQLATKCAKDVFCNIARSGGAAISTALKANPEYLVSKYFTGHKSLSQRFEEYQSVNSCMDSSRSNCGMEALAAAVFLPVMLANGVISVGKAAADWAGSTWAGQKVASGWSALKGMVGGQPAVVNTAALTNAVSNAQGNAGQQSNQQVDQAKNDPIKAAEQGWGAWMIEMLAQTTKDQVICKRWKTDATDWERLTKNVEQNCAEKYTKDNLFCDGCDFAVNAVCTAGASIAGGSVFGGAALAGGGGLIAAGGLKAGGKVMSTQVGKALAEGAARRAIQARALAHVAATRIAKTRAGNIASQQLAVAAEATTAGLVKAGQKTIHAFSVTDDVLTKQANLFYGPAKTAGKWYFNVGDAAMKATWKKTMQNTLGRDTLRANPGRSLIGGAAVNAGARQVDDALASGSNDVARNVADNGANRADDAIPANKAEAPAAGAAPEATTSFTYANLSDQQLSEITAELAESATLVKAGTLPKGALENTIDTLGYCPTPDCQKYALKLAADTKQPELIRLVGLRALYRHPEVPVEAIMKQWDSFTPRMKAKASEALAIAAPKSEPAAKALEQILDSVAKNPSRSVHSKDVVNDAYRGLYRRDPNRAAKFNAGVDNFDRNLRKEALEDNAFNDRIITKQAAAGIVEPDAQRSINELLHEGVESGIKKADMEKKFDEAAVLCTSKP